MEVQVNKQNYILTKNDFIASGGEGSIYVKNNTVFKIYEKQNRTIPQGKIDELSTLSMDNIIRPMQTVYKDGLPVGYTMKYISHSEDLCKLFTKAFKSRNNISQDMSMELVRIMQRTITHVHSNNVLIVDLNELNFLTDDKFSDVYFIDVDSYQTLHYPATAIMESIRDRHCKDNKFNIGTDWFAFAIVSFQMLIGIHPYKGKHQKYKTLDDRMVNNISVFDNNVSVPKVCPSVDTIPSLYRSWYKSVLQDGLRDAPPDDKSNMLHIMPMPKSAIFSDGTFEITEIYNTTWDIKEYINCRGNEILLGHVNAMMVSNYHKITTNHTYDNIIFHGDIGIGIRIENGELGLYYIDRDLQIPFLLKSPDYMVYDNNLYIKYKDIIYLVKFIGSFPLKLKAVAKPVGNVMEKATRLFQGVAIQNMLGTYYVSIFNEPGKCYQANLSLAKGSKVVDAKYDKGIMIIITAVQGVYNRFVYYFNGVTLEKVQSLYDIDYEAINFAVSDSGMCIMIDGKDNLHIIPQYDFSKKVVYKNSMVTSSMRLYTNGAKVYCIDGNKLLQIKKVK